MLKQSRTSKNGHAEKSEPIYYLALDASQAEALFRAVQNQTRAITKRLLEMTSGDGYGADDRDGVLHELRQCNDLDREVGGVVGYFDNGNDRDPNLRQKAADHGSEAVMTKKHSTSRKRRTKKTEPTVAVMLTTRDLIVLQQAVDERMSALSASVIAEAEGEDRDSGNGMNEDHKLNEKLLDAVSNTP